MASNSYVFSLERKIIGGLMKLKRGEIKPDDKNLNCMFESMMKLDYAIYEDLLKRFVKIVNK